MRIIALSIVSIHVKAIRVIRRKRVRGEKEKKGEKR